MDIVEFIEKVYEHPLMEWQKEFVQKLYINTSQDGADINTQLYINKLSTTCDKVLF